MDESVCEWVGEIVSGWVCEGVGEFVSGCVSL